VVGQRNSIMNRNMRHSQIILLCSILLVLVGCHNNAHLRTQKILKPGEKAYSASGVLALGGEPRDIDLDYTGVPGVRGEISMLTGSKDSESGPYLGFGSHEDDWGSFIVGYDYKKYVGLESGLPKKLGIQGELNYTPKEGGYRGFGSTFHFRPSFTTTTTKEEYFYSGIHGVLAVGRLNYTSEWDDYIAYNFNSLGLGITAGVEFLLPSSSSIQIQIDASLLQNAYAWDIPSFGYYKHYDEKDAQSTFLLTGSGGISFFKPDPASKEPFEPLPTPSYSTTQTQPIFDPKTGEKISGNMRFDPETGKEIQSNDQIIFDPETGKVVDEKLSSAIIEDAGKPTPVALDVADTLTPFTHQEIVFMAKRLAKNNHSPLGWALSGGVASLGGGFVGSMVGLAVNDSEFLPFLVGGGLGLVVGPPLLVNLASTKVVYPKELNNANFENTSHYASIYKKEARSLRSRDSYLIIKTAGVCSALMFLSIVFSL